MKATAASKTVRVRGATREGISESLDIAISELPRRVIRRCPAIIFAVRRTQSVMGRMIFLVISISTMNLIRAPGVPCGTKCDNIWFVFFVHPNRLILSHIVKDKGRVMVRCEDTENT